MTKRILVGLTGGIASGKSAVASLFEHKGAVIVDSDLLAREVVQPGTIGLEQIRQRFTDAVITDDGHLDRAALGQIVFNDSEALADLNAIVHPLEAARRAEVIAQIPSGLIVAVIPLLVENGLMDQFDCVVVVDVEPQTQIERLMARDHLDRAHAQARIDAQISREERLAKADVVISNCGDLKDLERKVDRALAEIFRLAR